MGIHSCSGPIRKKELLTVMLGGELVMRGAGKHQYLHSKDVKLWSVPCETLSLLRIQTLSLSTVFIDCSQDWLN